MLASATGRTSRKNGKRAHNVRPYGLYRDKTQFSAPDYILRQYRIILSADTASEVRQMLSQKRR